MQEVHLVHFQAVQLGYFQELWKMKESADKNFRQLGMHGSDGKLSMDMRSFVCLANAKIL
jgi:hypothetical protein